jgi:hypothetical protein
MHKPASGLPVSSTAMPDKVTPRESRTVCSVATTLSTIPVVEAHRMTRLA